MRDKKRNQKFKKQEKDKKQSTEQLICVMSALIFDHSKEEGRERHHISHTGLLSLSYPSIARPFYCSVGLLNTYSAQLPSFC